MKITGLFIDGIVKGVSEGPYVTRFMSMQCLQLSGREGTHLASLMTSDD